MSALPWMAMISPGRECFHWDARVANELGLKPIQSTHRGRMVASKHTELKNTHCRKVSEKMSKNSRRQRNLISGTFSYKPNRKLPTHAAKRAFEDLLIEILYFLMPLIYENFDFNQSGC